MQMRPSQPLTRFKRGSNANCARRKTNRSTSAHSSIHAHGRVRTHKRACSLEKHPSLAISLNDRLSACRIAAAFHRKWVSVVQIAVGLDSHPQPRDQEGSPPAPPAHCQSQRGGIWLRAGCSPDILMARVSYGGYARWP